MPTATPRSMPRCGDASRSVSLVPSRLPPEVQTAGLEGLAVDGPTITCSYQATPPAGIADEDGLGQRGPTRHRMAPRPPMRFATKTTSAAVMLLAVLLVAIPQIPLKSNPAEKPPRYTNKMIDGVKKIRNNRRAKLIALPSADSPALWLLLPAAPRMMLGMPRTTP